jgi:hypothetical protein
VIELYPDFKICSFTFNLYRYATAIVCNVTPASTHSEETHSTLRFAMRAKRVTNNATVGLYGFLSVSNPVYFTSLLRSFTPCSYRTSRM